MSLDLTEAEAAAVANAAESILKIISFAQGRAESYLARRDELRLVHFPGMQKEVEEEKNIAPKSVIFFTKKEIKKMPTEFQRIFTIELPVHVRQKLNGVYEARFRKYGYNICVSSLRYEDLKSKFLASLSCQASPASAELRADENASPLFSEVFTRWLELKRPTIKGNTCHFYEGLFDANLSPVLGGRELREIRQSDVQDLINVYTLQSKWRTAMKIYQTLKAVFDFAVGEDLIEKSPVRMLRPPKYEEQTGCALTIAEEREFLAKLETSGCTDEIKGALQFLLYTGIRRSELASARIEDGFISVVCSKVRKGYRERRRIIPITPMLRKYLPEDLAALRTVRPNALTQAFKRLMPSHHLHELRHTFITRCRECGVSREIVSVWAGHAPDSTQTSNVYTHFSRDFMQKEGEKVVYEL